MCTKCVDECPTGAIVKVNFPVRKSTANIEKTESNIKEEEKA
jgi:epoxyqueuosine reductase QueG